MFLSARRYAYQQTFQGPYPETVLSDLATFCFTFKSPKFTSDRDLAIVEGRRQVWQRIAAHMNLTEAQAWEYFDGRIEVPEQ
jgi:hypothetical protein